MNNTSISKLRCAVYTRKSSEEGLEQEFNSLDAQRESCEAYIASQRSEGWVPVRDHYDDGGISGGTLERPALQRLLADIEDGLVDVVVVYKIDRLSRSLMDFAKLVEVFDRNQVTFVSVTQSFNTTTSMGRLTLNVLLSFAQFEREVTAERSDLRAAKLRHFKSHGDAQGRVPCDITGQLITIDEAHLDHAHWPFGTLIAMFREARGWHEVIPTGTLTAPQNQQTTTTFADPAIASAFKAFHHRTATLRVISAKANLSMASQQRRPKIKLPVKLEP